LDGLSPLSPRSLQIVKGKAFGTHDPLFARKDVPPFFSFLSVGNSRAIWFPPFFFLLLLAFPYLQGISGPLSFPLRRRARMETKSQWSMPQLWDLPRLVFAAGYSCLSPPFFLFPSPLPAAGPRLRGGKDQEGGFLVSFLFFSSSCTTTETPLSLFPFLFFFLPSAALIQKSESIEDKQASPLPQASREYPTTDFPPFFLPSPGQAQEC